jgi:hypothetical protein
MTTQKKKTDSNTHSHQETTMKAKAPKATKPSTHTNTETTMSKPTKTTHTTTLAIATSDIPSQLQAIEQACGYGDPLPDASRKTSESLIRRVPSSIIDRILALAVRGGGTVAGITLDPDAAKAALTQADEADEIATAADMLARRAQDQSIRLRSGVAGNASAIRTAMVGYAKTSQGASLRQENDEIRSLAKQHKAAAKGRKTRVENSLAATTPPATTATATAATEPPTHAETLAPAATTAPAAG